MNLLKIFSATLLLIFSLSTTAAVAQNGMVKKSAAAKTTLQTDTCIVRGDCGMCQKTILAAAKKAGATEASWDTDTKVFIVKYDATATDFDKIQLEIARSGYDTPRHLANDATYKKLPKCCQYDRKIPF